MDIKSVGKKMRQAGRSIRDAVKIKPKKTGQSSEKKQTFKSSVGANLVAADKVGGLSEALKHSNKDGLKLINEALYRNPQSAGAIALKKDIVSFDDASPGFKDALQQALQKAATKKDITLPTEQFPILTESNHNECEYQLVGKVLSKGEKSVIESDIKETDELQPQTNPFLQEKSKKQLPPPMPYKDIDFSKAPQLPKAFQGEAGKANLEAIIYSVPKGASDMLDKANAQREQKLAKPLTADNLSAHNAMTPQQSSTVGDWVASATKETASEDAQKLLAQMQADPKVKTETSWSSGINDRVMKREDATGIDQIPKQSSPNTGYDEVIKKAHTKLA